MQLARLAALYFSSDISGGEGEKTDWVESEISLLLEQGSEETDQLLCGPKQRGVLCTPITDQQGIGASGFVRYSKDNIDRIICLESD